MRFATTRKNKPAINIVPLLDILAIILIFLVVTTVFKKEQPAIEIQLPESGKAVAVERDPPAIIYVTKDREVFLDDKPINADELAEELQVRKERDPDFYVALKSDTDAPLGIFLKISEIAEEAGFTEIPVFTEQGTPTQETSE